MAERRIFIPSDGKNGWVETHAIHFTWHPGYSISQKQKSIDSLHENARRELKINRILEISTKSKIETGRQAGAYKLELTNEQKGKSIVERFYQGSKVFKKDGPFEDIYENNDFRFKSDPRLRTSGELSHFEFNGERWEYTEPFYDWLYINALTQNPEVIAGVTKYEAFTDIQFNHKIAYNCQAHSVALYLAVKDFDGFDEALKSKDMFIEMVGTKNKNNVLTKITENSDEDPKLPLTKS